MMGETLSAAELLAFDGMTARALRCDGASMVVLTLPNPVGRDQIPYLRHLVGSIAERLEIDRDQIVVLQGGCTLESLTADQLAARGLARLA